jgi:hypothetical protein
MGHSEMLLAVAGLDANAVAEHTRRLASGDWSFFSLADRLALSFAREHAKDATVTARELDGLVRTFGKERALDVIWWTCHCHYLTSIASAFELPLERNNVFDGFRPGDPKPDKLPASPMTDTPIPFPD